MLFLRFHRLLSSQVLIHVRFVTHQRRFGSIVTKFPTAESVSDSPER